MFRFTFIQSLSVIKSSPMFDGFALLDFNSSYHLIFYKALFEISHCFYKKNKVAFCFKSSGPIIICAVTVPIVPP